jgi:hypothetical protein
MYLDQFTNYKYEIIKKFINSQEIIDLLKNQVGTSLEEIDSIIDDQIMSYRFVPQVDNVTKSYITLSTRVSRVENNKILEIQTSVYIIVPYALIKLPSLFRRRGNRIDCLIYEINKILNDTRTLKSIGKIQLLPNAPFSPADNHDGYEIRFLTTDFNT